MYAADRLSGVYISEDGGERWALIDEGLRTRDVNSLSICSGGQHLYAGTEGEGVFRLDFSGNAPPKAEEPEVDSPDTGNSNANGNVNENANDNANTNTNTNSNANTNTNMNSNSNENQNGNEDSSGDGNGGGICGSGALGAIFLMINMLLFAAWCSKRRDRS